jgi:type I restriction enzyme S subunit
MHALRTLDLADLDTSTAIPGLNRNDVYGQKIPLSPLNEQKRIVTKVEELLTRVNATKERLAKVSMILKRFRQSVLAAACSGRLTADWREKYPVLGRFSEFLIHIRRSLDTKLLENSTIMQTEKNTIPDSWEHIELGCALESISNGIYKPEGFYSTDGVICLRMYNIQNGKIIWKDLKRMILTPAEVEKYSLRNGDVLVNRVNSRELVGKAAIIEDVDQPVIFESKNIRLRFIEKEILPKFVNFCFMTRMVRDIFEGGAKQTVGMATISQPQISKIKLPFPPLQEQQEIIRRVESMLKLAEAVEKRIEAAKVRAERLAQATLAKALRGELVPTEAELARRECRPYESASELLARIKSEREASNKSESDDHCRVHKKKTH